MGTEVTKIIRMVFQFLRIKMSLAFSFSCALGYILFNRRIESDIFQLCAGFFLIVCGASAVNQIQEVKFDGNMLRTANRPLPSGFFSIKSGYIISGILFTSGYVILILSVNVHSISTIVPLLIISIGLLLYNGIYTYLKRKTSFALISGAFLGALPPVIGWGFKGGFVFDPEILLVSIFFFLWQIPHFLLLLLINREDYVKAGFPNLVEELSKVNTCRLIFIWILALAVSALFLSILDKTIFPENILFLCLSVWLPVRSFKLLHGAGGNMYIRHLLIRVNLFALLITALLCVKALGFIPLIVSKL